MGIQDSKKMLFDIIQLEKERDEFKKEIQEKEKDSLRLNRELEFVQEEYKKIENSGVKKFLLGLTGKKEERLQESQNEIRRLRSELSTVEFDITSAKNRIEHIQEELAEIQDGIEEYIISLDEIADGEIIKNSINAARNIPVMRSRISEKNIELKHLLERATEIYTYGDINADMSGNRYNKRDSTLRNHTVDIKNTVNELVKLLDEYNAMAPEEIKIDFKEEWMDNKNYWDGQQIAEDSYDRVKKVDDWFFRFRTLWKKMQKQQDEVTEQLRNEVLDYLS